MTVPPAVSSGPRGRASAMWWQPRCRTGFEHHCQRKESRSSLSQAAGGWIALSSLRREHQCWWRHTVVWSGKRIRGKTNPGGREKREREKTVSFNLLGFPILFPPATSTLMASSTSKSWRQDSGGVKLWRAQGNLLQQHCWLMAI